MLAAPPYGASSNIALWRANASYFYIAKSFENDKIKISNIKFRPDRSSIVPYVEVDFSKIKNYLIKHIVIGPKCAANERKCGSLCVG